MVASVGACQAACRDILRTARRYARSEDEAWDLVQEAVAIALAPAYRTDDELIKLVLKGFITTKSYDWRLAKFLREDVGKAAKPYLEDTAKNHPSVKLRSRAASELKRY